MYRTAPRRRDGGDRLPEPERIRSEPVARGM